jgi:hypothetical protein
MLQVAIDCDEDLVRLGKPIDQPRVPDSMPAGIGNCVYVVPNDVGREVYGYTFIKKNTHWR